MIAGHTSSVQFAAQLACDTWRETSALQKLSKMDDPANVMTIGLAGRNTMHQYRTNQPRHHLAAVVNGNAGRCSCCSIGARDSRPRICHGNT